MCCQYHTDNTTGILIYSKTTIIVREEITGNSNKQVLITTIVIESQWDEVNGVREHRNTKFTITCEIENLEISDIC